MPVTIDDIKPGRLYLVLDPGEADSSLEGAIVLGAASHLTHAAVTVKLAPNDVARGGGWLGTLWHASRHAQFAVGYVDSDARFEEVYSTRIQSLENT